MELIFGLVYSAYGVNSCGGLSVVEKISKNTTNTFFFDHPGSNLVSSIAKYLPCRLSKANSALRCGNEAVCFHQYELHPVIA